MVWKRWILNTVSPEPKVQLHTQHLKRGVFAIRTNRIERTEDCESAKEKRIHFSNFSLDRKQTLPLLTDQKND